MRELRERTRGLRRLRGEVLERLRAVRDRDGPAKLLLLAVAVAVRHGRRRRRAVMPVLRLERVLLRVLVMRRRVIDRRAGELVKMDLRAPVVSLVPLHREKETASASAP